MIKENKRKIWEANAYSEEGKSVNSSRQHLHYILILPSTHLFAERVHSKEKVQFVMISIMHLPR